MDDHAHDGVDPGLPQKVVEHPVSTTAGQAWSDRRNQESPIDATDEYAELRGLLQDLPRSPEYSLHSESLRHMPDGSRELGWQNALKLAEKHDRDLCQAYREQIDTLLVFAGLFSAVVTAFAIESYQWLQDDPADASLELLRDVVVLLSQNLNLTAPQSLPTVSSLPDGASARINVLWFLSLTLSLSAALVAILCKQWLREFERDVGQSPETALAVRHIRFQGLEYWNVGTIITSVPLMLQLALALFLTGTVDLLWQLHTLVAGCVTAVVCAILAFYLSTTLLPFAQYAYICIKCCLGSTRTGDYCSHRAFTEPQCAFKSAQAWLMLRAARPVIDYALQTYASFTLDLLPSHHPLVLRPADSWVAFDMNWLRRHEHVHKGAKCAYQALAWVANNLEETYSSFWVWHCVWARWSRNKDNTVSISRAVEDIECVASAYPELAGLDWTYPDTASAQAMIFRCSLHTDIPANIAVDLILRIAPHAGVDSRWTCDALEAVCELHRGLTIRLSDEISMGLFHLAEQQTQAIIHARLDTNLQPERLATGSWAFYQIVRLTHRGSSRARELMPAISGLALRWLREQPVQEYLDPVEGIAATLLAHYALSPHDLSNLRTNPGVVLSARCIRAHAELWPRSAARIHMGSPDRLRIMRELRDIAAASYDNTRNTPVEPSISGPPPAPLGGGCDGQERSPRTQGDMHLGDYLHGRQSTRAGNSPDAPEAGPTLAPGI